MKNTYMVEIPGIGHLVADRKGLEELKMVFTRAWLYCDSEHKKLSMKLNHEEFGYAMSRDEYSEVENAIGDILREIPVEEADE